MPRNYLVYEKLGSGSIGLWVTVLAGSGGPKTGFRTCNLTN
jgi:hypothetical protein